MLSLREAMDQLLRESFVRPATMVSQRAGMNGIPVDIRGTDDEFVVTATLPGVRPEDVRIHVEGDTLTITGDVREESESSGEPAGRCKRRRARGRPGRASRADAAGRG